MIGKKPNILYVGVFGCDAYAFRDRTTTTFEVRAVPAIYLGHSQQRGCAIVRVLDTGKVEICRNVEFREGSFAHSVALRKGTTASVFQAGYTALTDQNDTGLSFEGGGMESFDIQPNEEEATDDLDDDDIDEDIPVAASSNSAASSGSDEDTYEVEEILNRRERSGKVQYQVKWSGYDKPTWEPRENLNGAKELLKAYEGRRPSSVRSAAVPMRVSSRVNQSNRAMSVRFHSDCDEIESVFVNTECDDNESEYDDDVVNAARAIKMITSGTQKRL
jgi:hypothetical protein